MALSDLFPSGDYRFHLTLQRAEPAEFFRPRDPSGRVLAERRRWLADDGNRYADLRPGADALLAETEDLARGWGAALAAPAHGDPLARLRALGGALEPDLVFLARDAAGEFHVQGGALCFPTAWALQEKLGRSLEFAHAPVPGLNAALAPSIHQLLARLKPGVAFLRDNWGLAATGELNLHPELARPRLASPLDATRVWLRVERQALVALPRGGGVLFGIRLELHPFAAVRADRDAAAGLHRALSSMPEEMARYKGLAAVRAELLLALG